MDEPEKTGDDLTSISGQNPGEELTDKQRVFVEEYLVCWNATEAARRAGYQGNNATLASIGSENLRKPNIQIYIEARFKKKAMGADEVLARLADMARSNMDDFINPSGRGYRLDLKKAAAAGKLHLIKKFSKGRKGTEIELYDGQAALEKLGRHLGLFKDIHEVTGKNGSPIEVNNVGLSDDERAARIAALLDTARERRAGQPPDASGAGPNLLDHK